MRLITLTVENPQAVIRINRHPTMISVYPVKNLVLRVSNSFYYSSSSFVLFDDNEISITQPKLITIAMISKQPILSPSVHHAKKAVQNGAVLNMVVYTTIGTIAIPNVIAVKAMVADIDRHRIIDF